MGQQILPFDKDSLHGSIILNISFLTLILLNCISLLLIIIEYILFLIHFSIFILNILSDLLIFLI